MANDLITALGSRLGESTASAKTNSVHVGYATVSAIHETSSDVKLDVAMYGGTLYGLPMTTACRGVAVGDRVIVQTYGHLSTVTGVIAHDNTPVVKRAGDTMSIVGLNVGAAISSSGTVCLAHIPCGMMDGVTPKASGTWTYGIRCDGLYLAGSSSGYESLDASRIRLWNRGTWIQMTITLNTTRNDYNNNAVALRIETGTVTFG